MALWRSDAVPVRSVKRYTPYASLDRSGGGSSPHSVPNFKDHNCETKFAGDLFRLGTKADDMNTEVSEPKTDDKNQADQIKNSQGDRVEKIHDR